MVSYGAKGKGVMRGARLEGECAGGARAAMRKEQGRDGKGATGGRQKNWEGKEARREG